MSFSFGDRLGRKEGLLDELFAVVVMSRNVSSLDDIVEGCQLSSSLEQDVRSRTKLISRGCDGTRVEFC